MFGLRSAASSSQMLINAITEESKLQGVYAYQHDINVLNDSLEEIIYKLQISFFILRKYDLTSCPDKCQLHQTAIHYLGFHIEHRTL